MRWNSDRLSVSSSETFLDWEGDYRIDLGAFVPAWGGGRRKSPDCGRLGHARRRSFFHCTGLRVGQLCFGLGIVALAV